MNKYIFGGLTFVLAIALIWLSLINKAIDGWSWLISFCLGLAGGVLLVEAGYIFFT
jgi:hypothetical protein